MKSLRVLSVVLCTLSAFEASADRPNIVLIVADDLGYGDLSCYGSEAIETPAIDQLAADGVRFTQFYANAPECTPTRAALLTGRYQHRIGGLECAIGVGNEGRYDEAKWLSDHHRLGLPVDEPTLSSMLYDSGYATACMGKWHLGYDEPFHPMNHGFGTYFGPLGGAVDYFHHTEPRGEFLGTVLPGELLFQEDRSDVDASGTYLTDLLTDRAIAWLDSRSSDEPFFLYVPYTAPHSPYQGRGDQTPEPLSADVWNRGSKATYREMVEALDDGVERLVAAVAEAGAAASTIVIFVADNGPTKYGSAGTLRGNKGNVYEGGIRVPCVVRWHGTLAAGEVSDRVGITMDLTASLLAAAGVTAERELDGHDLLAHVASNEASSKRTLFWRIRRGARTRKAVRVGDWKYVHLTDGPRVERALYNLADDESETIDRSADSVAALRECQAELARLEAATRPRLVPHP